VEVTRSNPAIGLGSSFAVAMALFAWLGLQVDLRTGLSPFGVLAGVFLGLFYGAYEVWKLVRREDKGMPKGSDGAKDDPSESGHARKP
jgi:hypothetical protein